MLRPVAPDQGHCRASRLDGSMSAAQRGGELERFRSAPDVHVMLFSLMAGSTGLNLTVR